MLKRITIALIFLLVAQSAYSGDEKAIFEQYDYKYGFYINAPFLVNGVLEAQGEYRYSDKLSTCVKISLGSFPQRDDSQSKFFYSMGLGAYYSIFGDFDNSLSVGLEANFAIADYKAKSFCVDNLQKNSSGFLIYPCGQTFELTPFACYKQIFLNGFSLEGIFGAGAGINKREYYDQDGNLKIGYKYNRTYYKIALNLGWSFM